MNFFDGNSNQFKILINSCWAFFDMWENINHLYDKHWLNHPELLVISDENKAPEQFSNVLTFNGEMTTRLLGALKNINSEYIFFSFDDYYPSKQINEKKIESILSLMKEHNLDYCRLFNVPKVKGKRIGELKYQKLPLKNIYEVNFYPGLWKTDSLIKVLKENEVIWKAEARITRRARENSLNCICVNNKGIFEFVDVVRKGKYLRSAYRFIKKNDLYLSSRPKRTINETLCLNIRRFITLHTPVWFKNIIKNLFRRKGRVYYSDYENTDD